MKKYIFGLVILVLLAPGISSGKSGSALTATLCGKCHKSEANIIRGVLKGASYKEQTMNLDFNGHEETINFQQDTKVRNIASLREIARYKGESFSVYFIGDGNGRQALQIARFDHKAIMSPENSLGITDLEKLLAKTEPPKIIDIRPTQLFKAGHIRGAVNIPAPYLKEPNTRLPADREVKLVIYGNGTSSDVEAAISIKSQGYKNVGLFVGGFPEWEKVHYSVCSMTYARQQRRKDIFFIHLREDRYKGGNLGILPKDLDVSLTSLVTKKESLPTLRDTPIIVYGYDQAQGAAAIKTMGYRQVMILTSANPPRVEEMAAKGSETCY